MKAKWKFVVEGESGGSGKVKWLFWILAMIILMLATIVVLNFSELGPHITVYLW